MRATATALVFIGLTTSCAYAQVLPSLVVLYQFGRGQNEVTAPETTLVEIEPGVFVGSYLEGLFKITSAGEFTVLADFHNATYYGTAGGGPLTPASNGLIYGEAFNSTPVYGIYRVGNSGQPVFVSQGLGPVSPLVEGSDGSLWGTQGSPVTGYSVFKMSLEGVITTVSKSLLAGAAGPLLEASDGNYYGSATAPSATSSGQVFKVSPSGEYTVLYTFPTGEGSVGGLIEASNGLLYGTAVYNFDPKCPSSAGEVFSISTTGAFKTLTTFTGCNNANILGPSAGLVEASDGVLYGTTPARGLYNNGSIFQINLDGTGFKTIFQFQGTDGEEPISEGPGLIQGSDGNLYGTTYGGGSGLGGTVFELELELAPPLPRVQLIQPKAAVPGTTIRLKGNYLLGLSAVSFNGVSAAFTPINVNYANAVVPMGATTGPITVTTPNGSFTTKTSFTVE